MLSKIKVIYGPSGSGKSYLARGLLSGKKFIEVAPNAMGQSFGYGEVTGEHEVMFFDGVKLPDQVHMLKNLSGADLIGIEKRGHKGYMMNRPDIIITTEATADQLLQCYFSDFRFELIKCNYQPSVNEYPCFPLLPHQEAQRLAEISTDLTEREERLREHENIDALLIHDYVDQKLQKIIRKPGSSYSIVLQSQINVLKGVLNFIQKQQIKKAA